MNRQFHETALQMAEVLDARKAEDILLIDVSQSTILADTFLICTGNAGPHLKMLADELVKAGFQPIRMEGYQAGRWIVMDYGDVLVHIFHKEEREFYNIERLWVDGDNAMQYISPKENQFI